MVTVWSKGLIKLIAIRSKGIIFWVTSAKYSYTSSMFSVELMIRPISAMTAFSLANFFDSSSLFCNASSACLRSVMSLKIPCRTFLPFSSRILALISTCFISPVLVITCVSRTWPSLSKRCWANVRETSPILSSGGWRICWDCPISSVFSLSTNPPMTLLQSIIMPLSKSARTIPSIAFSKSFLYRSSLSFNPSSARLRSVMSRTMPRNPSGCPDGFFTKDTEVSIYRFVPSFLITSQSNSLVGSPVR